MPLFPCLKLTRQQYNNLTNKRKGDILVFQFFYPENPPEGAPTLRAYAMKRGHRKIRARASEDLEYDTIQQPEPVNDIRVQGDLQAIVDEIEEIKETSNPGNPEDYLHLFFKPKNGRVDHIIYEIRVVDTNLKLSNETLDLDPSPPATAE